MIALAEFPPDTMTPPVEEPLPEPDGAPELPPPTKFLPAMMPPPYAEPLAESDSEPESPPLVALAKFPLDAEAPAAASGAAD